MGLGTEVASEVPREFEGPPVLLGGFVEPRRCIAHFFVGQRSLMAVFTSPSPWTIVTSFRKGGRDAPTPV
jgi:hypothetical protein